MSEALQPVSVKSDASTRTRVLGAVLILIGAALSVAMGWGTWQSAPTFLHPGELIDGERFAGTREQGQFALALFSAVAMAGLAFVGIGAHQFATGRRDRRPLIFGALAVGLTKVLVWQMARML